VNHFHQIQKTSHCILKKEISLDLTGSLSFGCMYVFMMLLFSREKDRFFYVLKKRVSCFNDAPREQCVLIDMCFFLLSSILAN
jgi:hypothetical protein